MSLRSEFERETGNSQSEYLDLSADVTYGVRYAKWLESRCEQLAERCERLASLVDGALVCVELFCTPSPAHERWKTDWIKEATKLLEETT